MLLLLLLYWYGIAIVTHILLLWCIAIGTALLVLSNLGSALANCSYSKIPKFQKFETGILLRIPALLNLKIPRTRNFEFWNFGKIPKFQNSQYEFLKPHPKFQNS